MRIVCISDTHGVFPDRVPEGDVLIHAGDITDLGRKLEWEEALRWFDAQSHRHKISIPGNHDLDHTDLFSQHYPLLIGSSIDVEGLSIYGAPWQSNWPGWAYWTPSSKELWADIPEGTNLLVTHAPAYGILDSQFGMDWGCPFLLARILDLCPLLHVCGHIHGGYGTYSNGCTTFVNAALHDEWRNFTNKPIVIDL